MLFVVTESTDGLIDEVVLLAKGQPLFRFNADLWCHYDIKVSRKGWTIKDPTGRHINNTEVENCWVRKPFTRFLDQAAWPKQVKSRNRYWVLSQTRRLVEEIIALEVCHGTVRLAKPSKPIYESKAVQMTVAESYFRVPPWEMVLSKKAFVLSKCKQYCAKSLAAEIFPDGSFLFTRKLPLGSRLTPFCPWFIQEFVKAAFDLTLVYVDGECHAYQLARNSFVGDDWRTSIYQLKSLNWKKVVCPHQLKMRCRKFMKRIGLNFGRLDFLTDGRQGNEWFLEVNPNGEWGWLDPRHSDGLFKNVMDAFELKLSRRKVRGEEEG